MQTFSKLRNETAPWRAIGDLLYGMRIGGEVESSALDHIVAGNPAVWTGADVALFHCQQKTVGDPAILFPHATTVDAREAARDPYVCRWLDMLERLKPFNVKGQIAGIHRYLAAAEGLPMIADVASSLPWAGPVTRAERPDGSGYAALVRYVSLRHLGIHTERLRLVWLSDSTGSTDWVVTTVLLNGQWVVLDHYHGDIVSDDSYLDAAPYFSLNANRCLVHWQAEDTDGPEKALQLLGRKLRFGRA